MGCKGREVIVTPHGYQCYKCRTDYKTLTEYIEYHCSNITRAIIGMRHYTQAGPWAEMLREG